MTVFIHPYQRLKRLISWCWKNPLGALTAFVLLVLFAIGNQVIGSIANYSISKSNELVILIADLSKDVVAPAASATLIYQPDPKGDKKYANFDIFLCEKTGSEVGNIIRFSDDLAAKNLFHQVRVRYMPPQNFPKSLPRDRSVVLYDADHDEKGWLHFLLRYTHESRIFPPPIVLPNNDESTPWYLSMFICASDVT